MFFDSVSTFLAINSAAPNEAALAVTDNNLLHGVIASTAAHQRAAVNTETSAVAFPTVGSHTSSLVVLGAKVWTVFKVHQVALVGFLLPHIVRLQPAAAGATFIREQNFGSAVEFTLEMIADGAERLDSLPTHFS